MLPAARKRHGLLAVALTVAILVGCSDTAGTDTSVGSLTVTVALEQGRPLPLTTIVYLARGLYRNRGWTSLSAGTRTGAASFTVVAPIPLAPAPDSIYFEAGGYWCQGVLLGRTTAAFSPAAPQLVWDLTVPRSGSQATVSPGAYCGFHDGSAEVPPATDVGISIDIDSVSGQLVYGHWDIGFSTTSTNQNGTFSGIWTDKAIGLQLIPTLSWPNCEARYRLLGTMASGDTIGPVELVPDGGCEVRTTPLLLFTRPSP